MGLMGSFLQRTSQAEGEESMATTATDLPELLKGIPAGAWVAISENQNRALAFGFDVQIVHDQARQMGEDEPLMVRVPDQILAMFL